MQDHARWLMVMSLALAAGCAATGDEQNYKVLEEDHPTIRSEEETGVGEALRGSGELPPPDVAAEPATSDTHAVSGEGAPEQQASPAVAEGDAGAATNLQAAPDSTADAEATDSEWAPAPAPEPTFTGEPSLNGLDRSHWETVHITPDAGRTPHNPVYFRDYIAGRDDRHVLSQVDTESRILIALEREKPENWSLANAGELFLQPLKFGLDGALLLPRQAFQPLWSRQYTPPLPREPGAADEEPLEEETGIDEGYGEDTTDLPDDAAPGDEADPASQGPAPSTAEPSEAPQEAPAAPSSTDPAIE